MNVLKRWMQPIVTFFMFPYFLYYVGRYEEAWEIAGVIGVWALQIGYPIAMAIIISFMLKKRIHKKLKSYLYRARCYIDKYFYRGYAIACVICLVLYYPLRTVIYLIFCLPIFIDGAIEPFYEQLLQAGSAMAGIFAFFTRVLELVLILASPIIELFLCGILALVVPLVCMRFSVFVSKKLKTVPALRNYQGKSFRKICIHAIGDCGRKQYKAKLQKETYEACLKDFRESGDYAVLLKDYQIFQEINRLFMKSLRTEYDLMPIVNEDRDNYLQTNKDKFQELEEIVNEIYEVIRERCEWIRNKRYIINSLKYSKWSKGDTEVQSYATQIISMEAYFMEVKHSFEDVKHLFEDLYSELGREYYGIHKGLEGEKLVSNLLEKYTDSLYYYSGITLKHGWEKCEIDDLIVCPQGIYVVEVKNIGNSNKTITIDKTGRWQDSNNKEEYATWNAKIQNDKHVRICEKIVNEILGRNMSNRLYVQGIIVIANDETNIVNYSEQKIVRVNGLIDVVRAGHICLNSDEMNVICEKLENYRVPTSMYEVKRYDKIADEFDRFLNEIEMRVARCENLAIWKTELDRQLELIKGFNNKKKEEKYVNRY